MAAACNSETLSRPAAAKLITEYERFPNTQPTFILDVYHFKDGLAYMGYGSERQRVPDIDYFLSRGLLAVSYEGFADGLRLGRIRFTDSTKKFYLGTIPGRGIAISLCDFVFGEITGIHMTNSAGQASVEYTVRRINWTPFGEYYRKSDSRKYGGVDRRTITLKKYDDGWRVSAER